MSVILLTLFISLMLVLVFLILFLQEREYECVRSAESKALMPFEEEAVTPAAALPHDDGFAPSGQAPRGRMPQQDIT